MECLENKSARVQLYLGAKRLPFYLHLLNHVPLQGWKSPTGFLAKHVKKKTWIGLFAWHGWKSRSWERKKRGKQKRRVEPQINILSTTSWQEHGDGEGQGDLFDLLLQWGHICQIPTQFQHHWWTCRFSDNWLYSEVNNRWVPWVSYDCPSNLPCKAEGRHRRDCHACSILLWHNFMQACLGMEKGCTLILLQVTESLQSFSEHHLMFCKVPNEFIVCTACYQITVWENGMMTLNPKPILKKIILNFYAVYLLLPSDTTFLLILFCAIQQCKNKGS